MSVQKYQPGKLQHETKPYTQILNKVLVECRNLEALAVWCHLQSKPTDWIVNVKYLMNHFNIGKDKAYWIMDYLITTNLMEFIQLTDDQGRFIGTTYIIKNGEAFIHKDLPKRKKNNNKKLSTPFPENPDAENPDAENPQHTNKRVTTKERKTTNERVLDVEKFYPDQENQKLADKIASNCGTTGMFLINKFKNLTKQCKPKEKDLNILFKAFLNKELPAKKQRNGHDRNTTRMDR